MPDVSEDCLMTPALAATIAACSIAVPFAMSASSVPDPNHPWTLLWYKTLREPRFKPPDWAFPVSWTAIESALALAAYRLLRASSGPSRRNALALWAWNVVMIGGWSRLFFKRHHLDVSTAAAAGLVASSTAFVYEARKVDKIAAGAGLPLVAWVTFATVLTGAIWHLNSRRR